MAGQHITGLVLGVGAAEWTTLVRTKEKLAVDATVGVTFDPAAAAPEGAEAKTPPSPLADAIKAKPAAIPQGIVSLGLPSSQVLLRVVSLPPADEAERRGMVELQLDKISPFPVETMVVSHEVLGLRGEDQLVLIGAVQTKVLDDLRAILARAGIDPRRVDANILGFWRLLCDANQAPTDGRHILLVLDGRCADLVVVDNGLPVFVRSLGDCDDHESEQTAADLVQELSYTLMSLELESGAALPHSVVIWHRGAKPVQLVQSLQREFSCAVSTRPLGDLPPVSEGLARRMADGPGVAAMDLTPPPWKVERSASLFKRRLYSIAGAAAGLWLLALAGFFGGLAIERARQTRMEKVRDQWHEPAMAVREMRRRVAAIKRYLDNSHSALETLREVSVLLPEGVQLTGFTYKKGDSVKVSGEAPQVDQVYAFKSQLDGTPLFLGATLTGPRFDERRRRQIFDVTLSLPGGEE